MPANIHFVSDQPYPRGMAGTKRIRLFAEYLSFNGCAVTVLVQCDSNAPNEPEGIHGRVKFRTLRPVLGKNILNLLLSALTVFGIMNYLRKQKKTGGDHVLILYNGLSMDNLPFLIFGKMMRYSVVVDIVEDYSSHEEEFGWLHRWKLKSCVLVQRAFLPRADGIVVVSSFLEEKYRSRSKSFRLIKIPVSAGNVRLKSPEQSPHGMKTSFLYGGTYDEKDGLEFLLYAFDTLSRKYDDIELLLTGRMNRKTEALIRRLANGRIKYLDMIPDDRYYDTIKKADVLCVTRTASRFAAAGFPFKLGEYLATGKPVIATAVGDVPSYLEDKVDVILSRPSDVDSLVQAMEFSINQKKRSREIGLNGRRKALKYFHPRFNGRLLLDFIRELSKEES